MGVTFNNQRRTYFKMQKTCIHCENKFEASHQRAKYCSLTCNYEGKKAARGKWEDCCKCLAIVGFNIAKTSALTGKDQSEIRRARRRYGWSQIIPKCGTWGITIAKKQNADKLSKAETILYLKDYSPKFPEWKAIDFFSQYELMSDEQKKRHNKMTADRVRNCSKSKQKMKEWRERNKDHIKEKHKQWMKTTKGAELLSKYRQYPENKIKRNLRKRMRDFLRKAKAEMMSVSGLIGCTSLQFKHHLESQFKSGMTWDNYGMHWHVDHILPCATFDHKDKKQVKQCWHFTNLRPLGASENIAKSDKITEPQLKLLL